MTSKQLAVISAFRAFNKFSRPLNCLSATLLAVLMTFALESPRVCHGQTKVTENSSSSKEDIETSLKLLQDKSKTCESAAEYTALIDDCKNVLEQPQSESNVVFVRKLLSWSHNRRAEKRLELYDDFIVACNKVQAEKALGLADKDFRVAIENDSTRWRAWLGRASVACSQEDYAQAIDYINHVCELQPENTIGFFNRAELQYALGEYQAACDDYSRVILVKSDDLQALTGRAHCLCRMEKFGEAVKDYDEVCRLGADAAEAHYNRAMFKMGQVDFAAAQKDFETAAQLGHVESQLKLVQLLSECNDASICNLEMAQDWVDRLQKEQPTQLAQITLTNESKMKLGINTDATFTAERPQANNRMNFTPLQPIKK